MFTKKSFWLVLALIAGWVTSPGNAGPNMTILADENQPQISFAVQELQAALQARGQTADLAPLADVAAKTAGPRIVLGTQGDKALIPLLRDQGVTAASSLQPEGFSIRTSSNKGQETFWVVGANAAGAMYGGLELAEVIRCSGGRASGPWIRIPIWLCEASSSIFPSTNGRPLTATTTEIPSGRTSW